MPDGIPHAKGAPLGKGGVMMERRLTQEERLALQAEELEILQLFDRICETNDFTYFLTAGTLLGAVRHKGFIPWDDDIDVAMPRREFERLKAHLSKQPPDGYFFQCDETDSNYPFHFAKLRKNNTEVVEPSLEQVVIHKGLYIDIFPLDTCPCHPEIAACFYKLVDFITWAFMSKVNADFCCGYTKRHVRLLHSALSRFPKSFLRHLRAGVRRGAAFFCTGKCLCTLNASHGYPNESYEAEWFDSSVRMQFEGQSFPVPSGWHNVLTQLYGDYMKPPTAKEKQGHFIRREDV